MVPAFDGLPFDPFALLDDGLCPAEVSIGRRNVVQALMIAPVVVMLDERFDCLLHRLFDAPRHGPKDCP